MPKMTQETELQIRPDCPKCGSNANINLAGWTHNHDRRLYKCETCKSRFVYPYREKIEWIGKIRKRKEKFLEKEPLLVFDFEALKLRHNRIVNCNILENVPCFCCPKKSCSSESCNELTKWCCENE